MCLAAIAFDPAHRFPLVIAANRDEFIDRPAAGLDWWPADAGGGPRILAGTDLQGGGTWLGLSTAGRFALLTNVRRAGAKPEGAPSRGSIVPRWLRGAMDAHRFWDEVASAGHLPFNVVYGDAGTGGCWWASTGMAAPRRLGPGLYGLSNAALDTPWPKVTALKRRVAGAMASGVEPDDLASRLFDALADTDVVPDHLLPSTGVPLEWERALSPAFIHAADRRYGTRCSTLVVAQSGDGGAAVEVFERAYEGRNAIDDRHAALAGWPPPAGSFTALAPVQRQSVRTISTWGMPASSNTGPRSANPARE